MDEHLRIARAQYNAAIMPPKLIKIRRGQSMGNINEVLYSATPDNVMALTALGWEQAQMAGKTLKQQLQLTGNNGNASVHFIVSPYVRTVETFHGIVSAWCHPRTFAHIIKIPKPFNVRNENGINLVNSTWRIRL